MATRGIIFFKKILLIVAVLFSIIASSNIAYAQQKDFEFQLPDSASFFKIAGEPLHHNYSNITTVKLCYALEQKKLYFINSKRFRFHIDFCVARFDESFDIELFNNAHYSNTSERKYGLATLNYYADQHLCTIEYVSEDKISAPIIQKIYDEVKSNLKWRVPIKTLINNSFLLEKQQQLKKEECIFPEQLFTQQKYQCLVPGTAQGIVRIIPTDSVRFIKTATNQIIFIKGTPLQLPHCEAVITNALQTPLSHINVLCHNRGTAAAVIPNWDSLIAALNLNGKPVLLKLARNDYSIISIKNIQPLRNKKINKAASQKIDTISSGIVDLGSKAKIKTEAIGGKAAGLAKLIAIQQRSSKYFEVPSNAFCIPFSFYKKHTQQASIQQQIKLLSLAKNKNDDSTHSILKRVRKAIKDAPLDQQLLASVIQKLRATPDSTQYRFRSSSSAEDNEGFNGAGLYSSYSGSLAKANSVQNAIRKVWASVWNDDAYHEREIYHINHSNTCMAVLVHTGFPNEESNGVAITKNLFREDFTGFTINVQHGEVSVVAPPDSITCDQFVCMGSEDFLGKPGEVFTQYISRSNLQKNTTVLSNAQIKQLYQALNIIKQSFFNSSRAFANGTTYDDYALDIEFKFNNGKLVIKQVRAY